MQADYKLGPQATTAKACSQTPGEKLGDRHSFSISLYTEPVYTAVEGAPEPVKNCLFVWCSPMGLIKASLVGAEPGDPGAHPQAVVAKVGA